MKIDQRNITITVALVTAIIAGLAIRITLTWYSLKYLPPVSDEAAIALQAMEISHGKFPLFVYGLSYLFPIDSYTMAPFIDVLPRTSLGVRYQNILLGYIALGGFILLVRQMWPQGKRWPAVLMLLLPSAYWCVIQSAYSPPQYALTTTALIGYLWLAIRMTQGYQISGKWLFISGILGGLALSFQPVFISVVCAGGIVMVFKNSLATTVKRILVIFSGALFGLTPFFLAKLSNPEAFHTVTRLYSLPEMMQRIFDTVLFTTLPHTLGVNPPLMPDFPEFLEWSPLFRYPLLFIFLMIFVLAVIQRIRSQFQSSKGRWSENFYLQPVDMFILMTVMAVGLFALNKRAVEFHFRYLLPVLWSFPFLYCYVIAEYNQIIVRRLLFALLTTVVVFNASASFGVIQQWKKTGYIANISDTWDLTDLIDTLNSMGIRHCHASFWLAYRITHQTDREIICTPPYNEEALGWHVPDKHLVDASDNVAYIMTDTASTKISTMVFRSELARQQVTYDGKKLHPFGIFYNFRHQPTAGTRILDSTEFSLRTNPETLTTGLLTDGNQTTHWDSGQKQHDEMFIEATFRQPMDLQFINLFYAPKIGSPAKIIRVETLHGQKWTEIAQDLVRSYDRFEFKNNHPIYGSVPWLCEVKDSNADGVRIQIENATINQHWKLSEIEIGVNLR